MSGQPCGEKPKILVVDDDPDLAPALRAILESFGYETLSAGSRPEGMEVIQAEKPDLIILDVMMGTWDSGFEMARQLKADEKTRDIAILMLTGVKGRVGIDFKSAAGDETWCPVDGFLDKPADPDVLLKEIRRLLGQ